MNGKEAKARIKINKLLEAAGWRFFNEAGKPATITLETHVKLKPEDLGDDFEHAKRGFVDYLLLDEKRRPIIVLAWIIHEICKTLMQYINFIRVTVVLNFKQSFSKKGDPSAKCCFMNFPG